MQQQTPSTASDVLNMRLAWLDMQRRERAPRQRDAAMLFGVSEAQLVASQCGDRATRLAVPNWLELIKALENLGNVMALTRNDYVVIEKDGTYQNVAGSPGMAQVVSAGVDLRLFLTRWHSGFGLVEAGPRGHKRSLQFFDATGTAVHKVFLRPDSDVGAFNALVRTFAADDQSPELAVEPAETDEPAPDDTIDAAALRADWRNMRDTHEFFSVLRKHNAERQQAFRLVGADLARPVSPTGLHDVLDRAAETGLEIMIFVGNRGCIEIHSGPVHRIVSAHGWLNVLDAGFNLHAREQGLHRAWVVHKPTADGVVTSLEVFSPEGDNVALLFAHRKTGGNTVARWKELLGGLQ